MRGACTKSRRRDTLEVADPPADAASPKRTTDEQQAQFCELPALRPSAEDRRDTRAVFPAS